MALRLNLLQETALLSTVATLRHPKALSLNPLDIFSYDIKDDRAGGVM